MIDTHVHFWDFELDINSWVKKGNREDLKRSFTLTDYFHHYPTPEAIVTIESADDIYTLIEVEWVRQYIVNNPYGIKIKHMAFIDVLQPTHHFIEKLNVFAGYSFLCGFRHILVANTEDPTLNPTLMLQLKDNLKVLKEYDYIFDCQMNPAQLLRMADIINESGVHCVVDHAGLPNFATQAHKQQWLDMLKCYAQTSVYFKLTENLPEVMTSLTENLSKRQLLIGSNYPVSIHELYDLPQELIDCNTKNARKLFKF